VTAYEGGRPIRLKLQQRLNLNPCDFHTLSWRTDYPGTTQNRRFYWTKNGCWTLFASTARDLLERAAAEAMLAKEYDDPYERFGGGAPSFLDSTSLSHVERAEIWREITREGREPDWGHTPAFVIATEAAGRWRKIMIVDTQRRAATFRSCTTNASYGMAFALPTTATWRMDNAMQDASTAIMRRFLEFLRG
jgi:hypothetical protein